MGSGDRFDVFLSYARNDGALAAELNGWLCDQGLRTFFDRSELRPGLRWIEALEDAINRSDAVAILVGRHAIGNTQQYERELALMRQTRESGLPVIPVLMPGCENPPTGFLQLLTWIDLSRGESVLQQTESLKILREAIHRQAVPATSIRNQVCPYRGLEPFREEDAALFCGRDDAVRDLIAHVQKYQFVALVGPSGSGKSSLVFAGLLPALRQQRETTIWDIVSFRPGDSPLHALAAAFGTVPENDGPAAARVLTAAEDKTVFSSAFSPDSARVVTGCGGTRRCRPKCVSNTCPGMSAATAAFADSRHECPRRLRQPGAHSLSAPGATKGAPALMARLRGALAQRCGF